MRKTEIKRFRVTSRDETPEPSEVEISITALDGNTAGELLIRLLQVFGPSLLGTITAMESDDMSKVMASAGEFFNRLTPAEFKTIRGQLFRGGRVSEMGEFADLSDAFVAERFAGHAGSLMALVFFALKVNFANFFEDLGVSKERLASLASKVQKKK